MTGRHPRTFSWACAALLLAACAGPPEGEMDAWEVTADGTGRSYAIQTWAPDGAAPVASVYALDGDQNFGGVARLVARRVEEGTLPPTLVVAIGYADENGRAYDYTPTASPDVEGSGEAEAFFTFVTTQLVPDVDGRFGLPDDPAARTLVGHSLGGLAVTYALLAHDDVFRGFVAASPAFMWDGQSIFGVEQARADSGEPLLGALHLSIGAREAFGYRAALEAFADRLEARGHPDLRIGRHVVAGGQHNASEAESFERGLEFVLPGGAP